MIKTPLISHRFYSVFLLVLSIFVSGCSSTLSDYESSRPEFNMQDFFTGKLHAYGMVQDRSGKVLRRFRADLIGTWNGNSGILKEVFYYDDGEEQQRNWSLVRQPNDLYVGTAGDVIGQASGRSKGFAFNWRYTLAIDVDGQTWNIDLNDWIYQLDESRLINRTKMTKWGFNVGEITLLIEKDE